ncbi:hypothetical protein ACFL3P_01405 [Pseudomonadota bacterium]
MPTKSQLLRDKVRVVVLDIDDSSVGLAESAKLGVKLRQKVESLLSEGGVDVIDRNLAASLQKEIMLAEMKGQHEYKGPEVADYGVNGNVIAVNFSSSYSKASSWVDKKGETHRTPPKCRYSIEFEGYLKVHALPSLQLVDTIKLTDTESRSHELEGYSTGRCPNYSKKQLNGLVAQAAVDAVVESTVEIKNNFAPLGYITEARSNDGNNIFKITMGKLVGVQQGQNVNVFQFFKNEDILTGETNIEETKLVSGIVSNKVGNKYAWIIVDDAEKAKRIRLGDAVKVHYENNWFDNMKNAF